ncbi:MAG: efflux RND transporter permease subunit [Chthonomonadaceae bacterium]|nr:efflux RND transporter permease subunit [Chthonomonadaceae bacterium]
MNIGKFSVTRPVTVTMRIAALVLLGVVCLTKLPIDLLPKISVPTVLVLTQWPNVAPEEMETQITRPLEQAVSSASNIYNVSSSSTQGNSNIRVQFNYGTDIGQAAVDVLQLVERARQRFPTDPTLQTPVVFKLDPSQLPILIYGVSGEKDPAKLKAILNNQVAPILQSANGVASAVATGGADRAIIVDVDPDKLRSYHLSLSTVSKRIVEENLNLPAGIAKQSDTEYTIRSIGDFNNPQEIASVPVGTFNGQNVSLGQVATVRDAQQEIRLSTRLNGEAAVGMIIVKQSEANTVDTANNVREKLKQVSKLYPNLKFGLAYDQSEFITHSIDDVKFSAIVGGGLAIVILMMFLRNFRSTLVVALSIPISIFSTFTLLYFCGFTLNNISLSGLSLATGLIVDDAVVVLENIFRHIERDKKSPSEAAISGTNEITSAVFASTITIMVVFLPLFLIKGQSGQLFTQFALVVIFSIGISLLDALTVVPMLASRLIKQDQIDAEREHHEKRHSAGGDTYKRSLIMIIFDWFGDRFDNLDSGYRKSLEWALKHRWRVIIGAFGLTIASGFLIPFIGSEVLPQTDSGNFNVTLRLPIGTALTKTDETVKIAEDVVRKNPDVETVFAASGTTLSLRGTTTTLTPYQGSLTVRLKEDRKKQTQEIIKDVQKQLGQKLSGARAIVTPYDLVTQIISGGNQNIEIDIYGTDLPQLAKISREVLTQVRTVPGMENADTNVQDATPELQFKVDRQKALQLGINFTDVASALNTATNGTLSSYYRENGFQYPIYVQLPEGQRKSVEQLLDLPLTPTSAQSSIGTTGAGSGNGSGAAGGGTGNAAGVVSSSSATTAPGNGYVLLRQVAQPVITTGPNEITRQNSQRYIAITSIAQGRSQSEVLADLQKLMAQQKLPAGYYWDFGVQQKQRAQEYGGLGLSVLLAIALIYMLLASQFESFLYPLTILATVPLSIIGVVLGLFLTGRAFGLTAFIGLLLLVGIVVKNGILLIEYTNQLRERGMGRTEAVLTASPTRLRPILMTTSAAILGMIPLALAYGRGTETQAPLATAVIGGLTTSTLLTLFVVPCVYTLLDDFGRWVQKDKRDLSRPTLVEATPAAIEAEKAGKEEKVTAS